LDTALFFLLYFLYVWLVIDPRFVHHAIGILTPYYTVSFNMGWPFFLDHLGRAGGPVEYATRFLWPLYAYGWLGALIITAIAWITCLTVDAILRAADRSRGMLLRCGPAVLLLVIYGNYEHALKSQLALLVSLFCFVLYLRLISRLTAAKSCAVLLAVCVAAFYTAGAGGTLFPVLVAVYEPLIRKRMFVGLAALLCALGVPWLAGRALGDAAFPGMYTDFLLADARLGGWNWSRAILYAYFPVMLAGAAILPALLAHRATPNRRRRRSKSATPWGTRILQSLQPEETRCSLRLAAVILIAGLIAWSTTRTQGRLILQMDYYCQRENWSAVLQAAGGMPRGAFNPHCNPSILLALYHTGRLGEELFSYPQAKGESQYDMLATDRTVHTHIHESRLFLALGQVNLAEKCAYEALEGTGDLPAILRQLALINIVKDRPETARIFLNALSKKPLHRREAQDMLLRLADDPRLDSDPRVRRIRRSVISRDNVSLAIDREQLLLALLEKKPDNKMAFEFLMAHYLRTLRPEKVVQDLSRLHRLGYREIPRHFQEAVLVHASRDEGRLAVPEDRLDPEILQQAAMFFEILRKVPDREEAMRLSADVGLGDSYFHYYCFGESGL
jgi:hypothetical protein